MVASGESADFAGQTTDGSTPSLTDETREAGHTCADYSHVHLRLRPDRNRCHVPGWIGGVHVHGESLETNDANDRDEEAWRGTMLATEAIPGVEA